MSMTYPCPCGRLVGTGGGSRNFSSSWDGFRGFRFRLTFGSQGFRFQGVTARLKKKGSFDNVVPRNLKP